jgi:uncharacterized protein (UPF0264 family)
MRLMISVISVAEAHEAILAGAEILDVKNPAEGSLGAQTPGIIRKIRDASSGKLQISVAIGDMPNLPGTAALAALGAATCGADFIKVGLHGSRCEAEAKKLLYEVRQAVQEYSTSVIAAGYADFLRAGTLDPYCLPHLAASVGAQGCLLDTAVKDGHNLFDFLNRHALQKLVEQSHSAGLIFALAGALTAADLPIAKDLEVDVIGIRTAVCRDNRRDGPLDAARVLQLCQLCAMSK